MKRKRKAIAYFSWGSGLSNRLHSLIGYYALSKCLNKDFYLCWEPGPACKARFLDLFAPGAISLIGVSKLEALLKKRMVTVHGSNHWYDRIWRENASDRVPWSEYVAKVAEVVLELEPKKEISDCAKAFSEKWNLSERTGVHIRNTDNLLTYSEWALHSPGFRPTLVSTEEGFSQAMEKRLKKGIFLTTDDSGLEKRMKRKFGKAVVTFPKTFLFEGDQWRHLVSNGKLNLRERTTSVKEAFIEMLLLAECRTVIGTYYSTFSKIAIVLGGVDYREIHGKRCVRNTWTLKGHPRPPAA